jgi:RNA polymerase sigma factor (TIGR02999 family)
VTALLLAWREGDDRALERLIEVVHAELGRIAGRLMARQRVGHSLQPTALVNEAYLRLVDVQNVNWQSRAHFLAMAARLMRRVLVDAARSKRYLKRGGGAVRVTFTDELPVAQGRTEDLVALDDALEALARVYEAAALLRTTRRGIYAMVERRQLPGIIRIGRRVLLRGDDLLHWLDQKRASSLE